MKLLQRFSKLSAILLIVLVGGFALGAKAHAFSHFRTGNNANVAVGETLDSTLFTAGKQVDIAGTVNGDVFCVGQDVLISGTVNGDVICGARDINISGHVTGNVRLAAQTIDISGIIDHNATAIGSTVNTETKSRIGGDATLGVNNLNLSGSIGRDLLMGSSDANIIGSVGRDIKGNSSQLFLESSARIGGSIAYTSNQDLSKANGAVVKGTVTRTPSPEHRRAWNRLFLFTGAAALILALILLINALAVTAIWPRLLQRVSQQAIKRPWWVLLTGFVATIVVPVLAILLIATIVGIPLAIMLILAWILICMSSGLFTAFYLGRLFWRGPKHPLMIMLLGAFALIVVAMLPIVGLFVMLVSLWLGTGMVLLAIKERRSPAKPNKSR